MSTYKAKRDGFEAPTGWFKSGPCHPTQNRPGRSGVKYQRGSQMDDYDYPDSSEQCPRCDIWAFVTLLDESVCLYCGYTVPVQTDKSGGNPE